MSLERLSKVLSTGYGVQAKRDIQLAAKHFSASPKLPGLPGAPGCSVPNGDDTAALPTSEGHLLFAAEGMLPEFVAQDPWFAGFCSIMVNVSDVSSMGGTAIAAVDVLFAGDQTDNPRIFEGMRAAADAFGVPVVGGHTSRSSGRSLVAVAILGRAKRLITSFDARPGDALVMAVDLRGSYRDNSNNFNAATCASSARLRSQHALLPELAEAGLVHSGKDISMAGVAGTLAMLCESSGCGAIMHVDNVPAPVGVELPRWLSSFPSYGFLLACAPEHNAQVIARFQAQGISAARVGTFQAAPRVDLALGPERVTYLDFTQDRLTGFGGQGRIPVERNRERTEETCL